MAIAVADAAPEVKAVTHWHLEAREEAQFEICETILKATETGNRGLAKQA